MDAHGLGGSGKQGRLVEQGEEELLKMLLEDRRTQERKATEKAKEREEEQTRHMIEHEQQVCMMQAQIEAMQHWMEHCEEIEIKQTSRAEEMRQLTLTKMLPTEDTEAYLSTFELLIKAFKIKRKFWTYKLSPQLTGKALLQAFTAMD